MLIAYDHTESKVGTRLPADVIEAGVKVTGLERYTGADLLISPLDLPIPDTINDMYPVQEALRKHTQAGMLIQRGTGLDAIGHTLNLKVILGRMQEWSDHCVFLAVGNVERNENNKAVSNHRKTDFHYNSYMGAIVSFQMHGGMYFTVSDDESVLPFLRSCEKQLGKGSDEEPMVRRIAAKIPVLSECDTQLNLLMAVPHIGDKRARMLLDKFGSLSTCLSWLSNPTIYYAMANGTLPNDEDFNPGGLGVDQLREIQAWMGLAKNQWLAPSAVMEIEYPIGIKWPEEVTLSKMIWNDKGEAEWKQITNDGEKVYASSAHVAFAVVPASTKADLDKIFNKIIIRQLYRKEDQE